MLGEWWQICRRVFSWQQAGVFLILSVGLTLATVMFAIGHSYSFNSLPYKDAERLVMIGYQSTGGDNRFPILVLNMQPFHEWRERNDLFVDVAAFSGHEGWRLVTSDGNIILSGIKATPNFFDVLGVWFPELEAWKRTVGTVDLPNVLFTHDVGTGKFGREAIGQVFRTREGGGIIAGGILPAGFAYPNEYIVGNTRERGIIPIPMEDIGPMSATVIGRLAPGITPQIVEQALNARQGEDVTAFFGKIVAIPLQDIMTESTRPIVWGSWALSGLVLILCAANLSGILLVRCSYRLREYSLRAALGAMFHDLARLLLLELAVISTIAGSAAWFAGRMVVAVISGTVSVKHISLGWNEIFFLIAGTAAVAFLGVLATLLVIARNYKRGFSLGPLTVFHSQRWTRMLLTTGQVAIAMLLLSLSYMTVRGYIDIFTRDISMDTNTRVVTVSHSPTLSSTSMTHGSLIENTLEALRGGDATAPVAVYFGRLFNNFSSTSYLGSSSSIYRVLTQEEIRSITSAYVSPRFFQTAKVGILAGREFEDRDRNEILINATFVRRMGWTPTEAVGQLLDSNMVIIGVVDDFPTMSWDETASMVFFRSLNSRFNRNANAEDVSRGVPTINYIVHPAAISRTGNVERTILKVDPDAVITRNAAWRDLLGESVRGQTFAAICATLFTIAAIAIVVIGIVNTVIFIIARRTRDIAVHMAVGASPAQVCWFVVSDMVKAGIVGILVGGLSSWWLGSMVAHLIHNGDRYMNLTGLALTSAVMIMVIALASLLPALRALRIEPSRALKLE